jgi:hypothetical protein
MGDMSEDTTVMEEDGREAQLAPSPPSDEEIEL